MSPPAETPAPTPAASVHEHERVFLVVVDESDEMRVALRYAARRAQHTGGRVALLYVIEPTELQHWMAVETLMREERREEAEALLQKLSATVSELAGTMPVIYIREGRRRDELLALLDEEKSISILVLATSTASDGPGPLITALTGKFVGKLRLPVTIVPGALDDEQIDALT
jgi:nucleotide-binding universal stress UspA family protein